MHPRSTPPRSENARRGPRADCVAPPSNIPDIAPQRAQDARWGPHSSVVAPLRRGPHGADCAPWGGTARRLAHLGATPHFHHGLLRSSRDAGRDPIWILFSTHLRRPLSNQKSPSVLKKLPTPCVCTG